MKTPILEVRELRRYFPVRTGIFLKKSGDVRAVDGVSLKVHRGETVGLVGESGCGKSTVGKTILNLLKPTSGQVIFEGKDLSTIGRAQWRLLRRKMQIIFQDPMESLNSRHTVGEILEEPFIIHKLGSPTQRRAWTQELLKKVGLTASSIGRFPHEFSGGQRQRIGIARAIALKPKLIVCDEAVSALDVSVQAQIINLLLELQRKMELSLLFIAHDLSVVRHLSDRVAVMYLGQIVEEASSDEIYQNPAHPYTRALISAIPVPSPKSIRGRVILEGDVPSPINPPSGCRFHTRCTHSKPDCRRKIPKMEEVKSSHHVRCLRWRELPAPMIQIP